MDKQEVIEKIKTTQKFSETSFAGDRYANGYIQGLETAMMFIDQLDEPETLTEEWLYENREMYLVNDTSENAVPVKKLEKLIVPKMDEPADEKPETVASVFADYLKAAKRLKEVLDMEVVDKPEEAEE